MFKKSKINEACSSQPYKLTMFVFHERPRRNKTKEDLRLFLDYYSIMRSNLCYQTTIVTIRTLWKGGRWELTNSYENKVQKQKKYLKTLREKGVTVCIKRQRKLKAGIANPRLIHSTATSPPSKLSETGNRWRLYGAWWKPQKPLDGYYKAMGVIRPNKTLPFLVQNDWRKIIKKNH